MYTKIRVMGVISALVWIGVGSTMSMIPLSLVGVPIGVTLSITLVGVAFSIYMGVRVARQFWSMAHKLQHQTYAWYCKQYPSHNQGVTCYSCGGRRVHVRALMGKLYHREHFCAQCGTTLYYSPEANDQLAVATEK